MLKLRSSAFLPRGTRLFLLVILLFLPLILFIVILLAVIIIRILKIFFILFGFEVAIAVSFVH
jgi:hypothetical protein